MRDPSRWRWVLKETDHCNKCGFCLPVCPTYQLTGQEFHSPRGRIAMVEAAVRGELTTSSGLEETLSHCVGCRACEPACPSGVHYERILEAGRNLLVEGGSAAFRGSLTARSALYLATRKQTFRGFARWGSLMRRVPLADLITGYAVMLPDSTGRRQSRAPTISSPTGPRVAFFSGCVMDAVFADANLAAQQLLTAAGYRVFRPQSETCCGAIHLHSAEPEEAKRLARANIAAFESEAADWIVNTAGGCGAMLQEYPELLADDAAWRERAKRFSARVRDFSTLLVGEAARSLDYRGDGSRVVLQNSCHLVNVQGVGDHPVRLLRRVTGDTFIPYAEQDLCCGSGGLYNINHRDWARGILDHKMDKVAPLEPTKIIVNNPGCHMQMLWGVERHKAAVRATVEHLATYLWRCHQNALGGEQPPSRLGTELEAERQ